MDGPYDPPTQMTPKMPKMPTVQKQNGSDYCGELEVKEVVPAKPVAIKSKEKIAAEPVQSKTPADEDGTDEFIPSGSGPIRPPVNAQPVGLRPDIFVDLNDATVAPGAGVDDSGGGADRPNRRRRVPLPMYFVFAQLFFLFCAIFALTSGTVSMCTRGPKPSCHATSYSVAHWSRQIKGSAGLNVWTGQMYVAAAISVSFIYHLFLVINFTLKWIRSPVFTLVMNLICLVTMTTAAALEAYYCAPASYDQMTNAKQLEVNFGPQVYDQYQLSISNIAAMVFCFICAVLTGVTLGTSLECQVTQAPVAVGRQKTAKNLSLRADVFNS